jgi:endonuclease YncB( thermonuclease family)
MLRMKNVLPIARNARSPVLARRAQRRIDGTSRRTARNSGRYLGLVAFVALAVGAMLLQGGYLHPRLGIGTQTVERFTAAAVDGDSLRTADRRIRLMGIDAPELFQTCLDEHGAIWSCGQQAHALLRALVSRGLLTCTSGATDRYGRMLATCSVADVDDVGDAMVRAGLAVSYRTLGYWPAELEARRHQRGMWRGSFERPQDYRRRTRR